jgi:hypothetical protein
MAHTTADLRRRIDVERGELADNMAELTARAKAAVDWREQVRRHPALTLGGALGLAFAVARLASHRNGRAARTAVDQGIETASPRGLGRPRGPLGPIGAAVVGTATAVLVGALEKVVVGLIEGNLTPRTARRHTGPSEALTDDRAHG